MNLIADSGAILRTLIPLPLQRDLNPPSWIIPCNPLNKLTPLVPWTCWNPLRSHSFHCETNNIKKKKMILTLLRVDWTWRKTFRRSKGAVPVRDTAPAIAPATSCLHTTPDRRSFSENSSGTVSCSPMSNIWNMYIINSIDSWSLQSKISVNIKPTI